MLVTGLSRPSLYGVTHTCVTEGSSREVCWVAGNTYPCWLPALDATAYKAGVCFLLDDSDLLSVAGAVGEDVTIKVDRGGNWNDEGVPEGGSLLLCDGRPSRCLMRLCERKGVDRIVSTRPFRCGKGFTDKWGSHHVDIDHHLVGGVTESRLRLFFHWKLDAFYPKGPLPVSDDIPRAALRDLSTILGPTVRTEGVIKAPQDKLVIPPQVRVVREGNHPVYHGGGLLPSFPTPTTTVATPSVRLPVDKKWGVRTLTTKELLEAYGLPSGQVEILEVSNFSSWGELQPVEALLAGLELFGSIQDHGGGSFLQRTGRIGCLINQDDDVLPDLAPHKTFMGLTGQKRRYHQEYKKPRLGEDHREWKRKHVGEETAKEEREKKATKADDAAVPVEIWNERYLQGTKWKEEDLEKVEKALDVMRGFLLRVWRRRVLRSFSCWMRNKGTTQFKEEGENRSIGITPGPKVSHKWREEGGRQIYGEWRSKYWNKHGLDLESAADSIRRASEASWWDWDGGSRPFHWRWPEFYMEIIRDGLPIYLSSRAPMYKTPQKDPKDDEERKILVKKLSKVRSRGYIASDYVVSLTSFFWVPKGEDDVRIAHNGTESGLNDATWVPSFWLPTPRTALRMMVPGTEMGDLDAGEMFLNYVLHKDMRKYCGVDLTKYFPEDIPKNRDRLWEAWQRTGMGFRWSPYQATQGMAVANEVIGGDRKDPRNIFRWDEVELNMPATAGYNPGMPWVYKKRKLDNMIAADRVIFVDDVRTAGNGPEEAWQATRRVGSTLSYLGLQETPRKRRRTGPQTGAWAGSVQWTTPEGVYQLTSEEKWCKGKAQVEELEGMILESPEALNHHRLTQIRGYLGHLAEPYPEIKPYLNGLHLTIDGWRENRDEEGWRLPRRKVQLPGREVLDNQDKFGCWEDSEAPETVKAVPRLVRDVAALGQLFRPELPPIRPARPRKSAHLKYAFGDASGPGFGVSDQQEGVPKIVSQEGQWPAIIRWTKSSNWREMNNFVEYATGLGEMGMLDDWELFFATDNTTFEAGYYKGYSASKQLDELILRLRLLQQKYNFVLHVVHVSGKRMIAQGTDGLSRGDKGTGSMAGRSVASFLPLGENALDRSPALKEWAKDVLEGLPGVQFLSPEGWFDDARSWFWDLCVGPATSSGGRGSGTTGTSTTKETQRYAFGDGAQADDGILEETYEQSHRFLLSVGRSGAVAAQNSP